MSLRKIVLGAVAVAITVVLSGCHWGFGHNPGHRGYYRGYHPQAHHHYDFHGPAANCHYCYQY